MRRRTQWYRVGNTNVSGRYAEAFAHIAALEENVMVASIKPTFTRDDVIACFWPPRVVDPLCAAFHLIDGTDRSSFNIKAQEPENTDVLCVPIYNADIRVPQAGMLCPQHGLLSINVEHPAFPAIKATLREMYEITMRFEQVRNVIWWLNRHEASAGAARYYFPAILSLVGPDHPCHESGGVLYKEPAESIAPLLPTIREASDIVAGALLAPKANDDRDFFTLTFKVDGEAERSQQFTLI